MSKNQKKEPASVGADPAHDFPEGKVTQRVQIDPHIQNYFNAVARMCKALDGLRDANPHTWENVNDVQRFQAITNMAVELGRDDGKLYPRLMSLGADCAQWAQVIAQREELRVDTGDDLAEAA